MKVKWREERGRKQVKETERQRGMYIEVNRGGSKT
jgi:hypothetical protein